MKENIHIFLCINVHNKLQSIRIRLTTKTKTQRPHAKIIYKITKIMYISIS